MSQTKKVVINVCFGGFSLSPRAVERLAELEGRPCYFFTNVSPSDIRTYKPITREEAEEAFLAFAFDVPDAHERFLGRQDDWHDLTPEQKKARNEEYERHQIRDREYQRDDPLLVQVVEELGEAANGKVAELKIVEIPADVEYEIDEYDGTEHIAEVHRTWR